MKSANQAIQTLLQDSLVFVEDDRARRNIEEAICLLEAVDGRNEATLVRESPPPRR